MKKEQVDETRKETWRQRWYSVDAEKRKEMKRLSEPEVWRGEPMGKVWPVTPPDRQPIDTTPPRAPEWATKGVEPKRMEFFYRKEKDRGDDFERER